MKFLVLKIAEIIVKFVIIVVFVRSVMSLIQWILIMIVNAYKNITMMEIIPVKCVTKGVFNVS